MNPKNAETGAPAITPDIEVIVGRDGVPSVAFVPEGMGSPQSEAERLIAQAVATRVAPAGIQGAIERLRELDEDAHVLWRTSGPRNSHIDELGAVLAEVEGVRRVYMLQAFTSGKVRFWAECAADFPPAPKAA